jgi:hypothetical protein
MVMCNLSDDDDDDDLSNHAFLVLSNMGEVAGARICAGVRCCGRTLSKVARVHTPRHDFLIERDFSSNVIAPDRVRACVPQVARYLAALLAGGGDVAAAGALRAILECARAACRTLDNALSASWALP